MKMIAIKCLPNEAENWKQLITAADHTIHFVNGGSITDANIYIDALYEGEGDGFASVTTKPILVNAVLRNSASLRENQLRYNGWAGFWEKGKFELAGNQQLFNTSIEPIFAANNWKHHFSSDTVGMLSARVVSMIINEAYFGFGEKISSKADIDTAMKLGTNYPYGPFEWAEKIGLHRIHELLTMLSKENTRYTPASLLTDETREPYTLTL